MSIMHVCGRKAQHPEQPLQISTQERSSAIQQFFLEIWLLRYEYEGIVKVSISVVQWAWCSYWTI